MVLCYYNLSFCCFWGDAVVREEIFMDKDYPYINPVQFGFEDCESSHFFGPWVRNFWLIHFVVSGKGVFQTTHREYAVEAGEMFVIRPYEQTYYEADANEPWRYIWIAFKCKSDLPIALNDVIRCPKAAAVFEEMKRSLSMENGRSAFLCAKIWELFSLLLEGVADDTDYVEKAVHLIHSGYMTAITVQGIANELKLDRAYFSTLFKKRMGVSPSQYLLECRMNRAADLMVKRGVSVSVAAYSVGYTDIYTFSKMFKKHFGLSPKTYVQQHK